VLNWEVGKKIRGKERKCVLENGGKKKGGFAVKKVPGADYMWGDPGRKREYKS